MRLDPQFLDRLTGFQWDEANSEKNLKTHGVAPAEIEEVFLNQPILVSDDPRHSQGEDRHFALGRSDLGRELAVVFTIRGTLIRVISARAMSRRERTLYAKAH